MNAFNSRNRSTTMLDLNRFLNNDCTEYAKKQKAFNYATDAEKHQANGEYIQALTSWNNVLSQNVARNLRAHVYNKRSLIYRETQLYKQCLNNIALAEYCGCTEDLSERKAFCERAIDKHGKNVGIPMPKKFLKLSYTVNPKLPFMVDCLKLETNSQHKYNIITERDLFVGDVIAIEDPFFTVSFAVKGMKASGSGQRCYHCNKDNFLNLMQCSTCDKVFFCSIQCHNDAFVMYHRYECVIINLVGAFQDTVRSMRLFFYSLYLFNDNIEDLKNFMMSRKDVRMTVFDYDLSDLKSRNSQKNLLHCYDSFVAPAFTNDAYAFRLIFEVHPILSVMWDTHKVFILTFFRRNIAINREYAKDLMKWQDNVKRSITDHRESICKRVGGGIYLFSSLINHSCVPNVERHISYNDKLHLIVCRDVKKGQQIFLSYMDSLYFSRFTKEERRDYLRKAHNFKCTCEACVGDQFPPLCDLLIKNTDLFGSITEFDKNLNTLTHKQLRDKYKYYMKVLRKNHAQFPSDELTRIQDHAFKILQHTSRPAYTFF